MEAEKRSDEHCRCSTQSGIGVRIIQPRCSRGWSDFPGYLGFPDSKVFSPASSQYFESMTDRPPVSDESVLMRWMALEMGKINDGVVTGRKRLSDLLIDPHPAAVTRGGAEYAFNKETLMLLGQQLPVNLHARLRLPIIFFFDSRVGDSFLLTDQDGLKNPPGNRRTLHDARDDRGEALGRQGDSLCHHAEISDSCPDHDALNPHWRSFP